MKPPDFGLDRLLRHIANQGPPGLPGFEIQRWCKEETQLDSEEINILINLILESGEWARQNGFIKRPHKCDFDTNTPKDVNFFVDVAPRFRIRYLRIIGSSRLNVLSPSTREVFWQCSRSGSSGVWGAEQCFILGIDHKSLFYHYTILSELGLVRRFHLQLPKDFTLTTQRIYKLCGYGRYRTKAPLLPDCSGRIGSTSSSISFASHAFDLNSVSIDEASRQLIQREIEFAEDIKLVKNKMTDYLQSQSSVVPLKNMMKIGKGSVISNDSKKLTKLQLKAQYELIEEGVIVVKNIEASGHSQEERVYLRSNQKNEEIEQTCQCSSPNQCSLSDGCSYFRKWVVTDLFHDILLVKPGTPSQIQTILNLDRRRLDKIMNLMSLDQIIEKQVEQNGTIRLHLKTRVSESANDIRIGFENNEDSMNTPATIIDSKNLEYFTDKGLISCPKKTTTVSIRRSATSLIVLDKYIALSVAKLGRIVRTIEKSPNPIDRRTMLKTLDLVQKMTPHLKIEQFQWHKQNTKFCYTTGNTLNVSRLLAVRGKISFKQLCEDVKNCISNDHFLATPKPENLTSEVASAFAYRMTESLHVALYTENTSHVIPDEEGFRSTDRQPRLPAPNCLTARRDVIESTSKSVPNVSESAEIGENIDILPGLLVKHPASVKYTSLVRYGFVRPCGFRCRLFHMHLLRLYNTSASSRSSGANENNKRSMQFDRSGIAPDVFESGTGIHLVDILLSLEVDLFLKLVGYGDTLEYLDEYMSNRRLGTTPKLMRDIPTDVFCRMLHLNYELVCSVVAHQTPLAQMNSKGRLHPFNPFSFHRHLRRELCVLRCRPVTSLKNLLSILGILGLVQPKSRNSRVSAHFDLLYSISSTGHLNTDRSVPSGEHPSTEGNFFSDLNSRRVTQTHHFSFVRHETGKIFTSEFYKYWNLQMVRIGESQDYVKAVNEFQLFGETADHESPCYSREFPRGLHQKGAWELCKHANQYHKDCLRVVVNRRMSDDDFTVFCEDIGLEPFAAKKFLRSVKAEENNQTSSGDITSDDRCTPSYLDSEGIVSDVTSNPTPIKSECNQLSVDPHRYNIMKPCEICGFSSEKGDMLIAHYIHVHPSCKVPENLLDSDIRSNTKTPKRRRTKRHEEYKNQHSASLSRMRLDHEYFPKKGNLTCALNRGDIYSTKKLADILSLLMKGKSLDLTRQLISEVLSISTEDLACMFGTDSLKADMIFGDKSAKYSGVLTFSGLPGLDSWFERLCGPRSDVKMYRQLQDQSPSKYVDIGKVLTVARLYIFLPRDHYDENYMRGLCSEREMFLLFEVLKNWYNRNLVSKQKIKSSDNRLFKPSRALLSVIFHDIEKLERIYQLKPPIEYTGTRTVNSYTQTFPVLISDLKGDGLVHFLNETYITTNKINDDREGVLIFHEDSPKLNGIGCEITPRIVAESSYTTIQHFSCSSSPSMARLQIRSPYHKEESDGILSGDESQRGIIGSEPSANDAFEEEIPNELGGQTKNLKSGLAAMMDLIGISRNEMEKGVLSEFEDVLIPDYTRFGDNIIESSQFNESGKELRRTLVILESLFRYRDANTYCALDFDNNENLLVTPSAPLADHVYMMSESTSTADVDASIVFLVNIFHDFQFGQQPPSNLDGRHLDPLQILNACAWLLNIISSKEFDSREIDENSDIMGSIYSSGVGILESTLFDWFCDTYPSESFFSGHGNLTRVQFFAATVHTCEYLRLTTRCATSEDLGFGWKLVTACTAIKLRTHTNTTRCSLPPITTAGPNSNSTVRESVDDFTGTSHPIMNFPVYCNSHRFMACIGLDKFIARNWIARDCTETSISACRCIMETAGLSNAEILPASCLPLVSWVTLTPPREVVNEGTSGSLGLDIPATNINVSLLAEITHSILFEVFDFPGRCCRQLLGSLVFPLSEIQTLVRLFINGGVMTIESGFGSHDSLYDENSWVNKALRLTEPARIYVARNLNGRVII